MGPKEGGRKQVAHHQAAERSKADAFGGDFAPFQALMRFRLSDSVVEWHTQNAALVVEHLKDESFQAAFFKCITTGLSRDCRDQGEACG